MKLYRNAIILVVILGLLIGAYAIVKNKKSSGDSKAEDTETIKILDFKTDDITEMTLENSGQKFVFVQETIKENDQEKKVWKVSSPADLKIDESAVSSMASNLSSLIADKIVEENAADLAKYGLDKPVTVSARLKDGAVKSVEVGNETPTKSGYYVKEKDSLKVYTVDSYTGEKLKVGRNDLRNKALFTVKPEDLISFSMERKGEVVFSSRKMNEAEWEMTAPIKGNVNTTALGPMLDAISQTSVMNFIEDNAADLGKYGLATPAYAMEFETSSGKNKILFGSEKEKGSEMYAKMADSNEVFTVSVSPYNFLDKPLKEIIEVFAYIVNINDVNKIVVEMDGQTTTSDIQTDKDDKDKDKFVVNNKDVTALKDEKDSQYFRKYYQALIGVTLAEIEPDANPTEAPEITFTYFLKKAPGTMKVEFIPKDDRYYYVVRNGVYTGILVEKKKFDEPEGVRDTYKKLKEAMDK